MTCTVDSVLNDQSDYLGFDHVVWYSEGVGRDSENYSQPSED